MGNLRNEWVKEEKEFGLNEKDKEGESKHPLNRRILINTVCMWVFGVFSVMEFIRARLSMAMRKLVLLPKENRTLFLCTLHKYLC